jgi:hypothetical protein
MRYLIFSALITAICTVSLPLPANSDYQSVHRDADLLYQNGDYYNAYNKYYKLAKDGDSFAQYRISYMRLMGQGKKEDVIESLAWSVLAAQNKQDQLVDYMQTVAGIVPAEKRKKADKKISQYMRKWGDDAGSGSRSPRGGHGDDGCTGSRLCNHSSSPRSVRIPGNIWGYNDSDDDQDLKNRVIELNQSILKAVQTGQLETG